MGGSRRRADLGVEPGDLGRQPVGLGRERPDPVDGARLDAGDVGRGRLQRRDQRRGPLEQGSARRGAPRVVGDVGPAAPELLHLVGEADIGRLREQTLEPRQRLTRKIGEGARALLTHGASGEHGVVPAGDADDVDAVGVTWAGEEPVARRPDGLELGALAVVARRRRVRHVVADQVEGTALGLQPGQAGVQGGDHGLGRSIDALGHEGQSGRLPDRAVHVGRHCAAERGDEVAGPGHTLAERDPGCRATSRPPGAGAR